jgi:hypothetical protein
LVTREGTFAPSGVQQGFIRYTFSREPTADAPRDLIVHRVRLERIVLSAGLKPSAYLAF